MSKPPSRIRMGNTEGWAPAQMQVIMHTRKGTFLKVRTSSVALLTDGRHTCGWQVHTVKQESAGGT